MSTRPWRVARSLDQLLGQINKAYPGRSLASDGSIGDAAHATRSSDHNPWYWPSWSPLAIVTARDFTHDPDAGFDAHALAERLRQSRDPRIKYVISDRRIFSSTVSPWQWRPYTGTNPHTKHVHVSVVADARCDDDRQWPGVTTWVAASPIPDLSPEEDDVTPEEIQANVRIAMVGLFKEAAERSTPTGRALGDHLITAIAGPTASRTWAATVGSTNPRALSSVLVSAEAAALAAAAKTLDVPVEQLAAAVADAVSQVDVDDVTQAVAGRLTVTVKED